MLETRYDVIPVSSIEELRQLHPDHEVKAVVLCHSLLDEDCVQSYRVIKRHWPEARILTLSSAVHGCNAIEANATVSASDGPAALLGSIAHLLQTAPSNSRSTRVQA